ncbi:hypothetical protein [Roseivivax sp. CAU 1761]
MRRRALVLAAGLAALVAPPARAGGEASKPEGLPVAPSDLAPYMVLLPPPDTGLPKDILDRMRERLVARASGGRDAETPE